MSIENEVHGRLAATGSEPDAVASGLRRWSEKIAGFATFVALLLLIEFLIRYLQVPNYVFPAPSEILVALYNGFAAPLGAASAYYIHIATTAVEALAAFVIGSSLGIVVGGLIAQFAVLRRIMLPYFIGLQSVPKVALAPLFVVWFGLGISSKILLGVLLTFFPLMINTAAGLAGVERDRLELMQSLKASAWKTFRLVQFPSALPFIFAGLEMAAAYSVLGAVVGEFVGGNDGLGVLILHRNAALDIAGSVAALVILALMGIALQRGVSRLRTHVLFWAPSPDMLKDER
jgi:NitT/TauT family transport system permease protein